MWGNKRWPGEIRVTEADFARSAGRLRPLRDVPGRPRGGGAQSAAGPACCLTVLAIQDSGLPVIAGVVVVSSSGLHGRRT
jgi:hypothetical protein